MKRFFTIQSKSFHIQLTAEAYKLRITFLNSKDEIFVKVYSVSSKLAKRMEMCRWLYQNVQI